MLISELKQLIKEMADAPQNKRVPILIEGEMGIGKSQAVQQAAEELGWEYVDLRLAQQEPGDLIGMPRVENGITFWSKPSWVPEKNKKLMLALEELNRAPIDVQQAIFQALTENKIHTHEFPKDTIIAVCVNPSNSIYHVADLDPATITRCCKVTLQADVTEWLKYASQKKFDEKVVAYVNTHQELLQKATAQPPCPTCRTWERVSDMLQYVPSTLVYETVAGLVGKEAAVSFQKFCDSEYERPVGGKDILKHYDKVKNKIGKQKSDAMFITIRSLITELGDGTGISKEAAVNLADFIKDLKGAEFKITCVKGLPEAVVKKLCGLNIAQEIVAVLSGADKAIKGKE